MSLDPTPKCVLCGHYEHIHFSADDEIGHWAFCMNETCECFIDERSADHNG